MLELITEIPDVETLLSLEPEELGAKLILLIKRRFGYNEFISDSLRYELCFDPHNRGRNYCGQKDSEIYLALAEAYSWLEAQGLIIQPRGTGSFILSRRAQKFESESDLKSFIISRQLKKEFLNVRIADLVWSNLIRGQYDSAVLQAMKAVEIAVREAAGFNNDLFGKKLMEAAFNEKGPLADSNIQNSETNARMFLFSGAIGTYKNPQSHRNVNLDNPLEAIEIIMFANHLLRIVDKIVQSKKSNLET